MLRGDLKSEKLLKSSNILSKLNRKIAIKQHKSEILRYLLKHSSFLCNIERIKKTNPKNSKINKVIIKIIKNQTLVKLKMSIFILFIYYTKLT